MKGIYSLLVLFALVCQQLVALNTPGKTSVNGFIENKGQILDQNLKNNGEVKYLLNSSGLNVQLHENSFSYDTYVVKELPNTITSERKIKKLEYKFQRIDVTFAGANKHPVILSEEPTNDYLNYYTHGTGEIGAIGVNVYRKVTYKNLYNGIDLEFIASENDGKPVKFNFIVHPGSDPSKIKWTYSGALTELRNGEINFILPFGNMNEVIPFSYWKETKKELKVKYKKEGDTYSFNMKNIRSKNTLVIDPFPMRAWSTLYGGTGFDEGRSCSTDTMGNIFLTGLTSSTGNIATAGAHSSTYSGGAATGFIAKFDGNGVRQWGTYYGSFNTAGYGSATNLNGDIYVVGETSSSNQISTPGSHQPVWVSLSDAYLIKFNSAGVRQWGTYYGASSYDYAYSCVTDSLDNVYMCGQTGSSTNIATPGTHQTTLVTGTGDGFVAKFNGNGVRQWGTYYGGAGLDIALSCSVDKNFNVFMCGYTTSTANIASPSAHQTTFGGGSEDAFLVKLDPNGLRLWGTYYGGGARGLSCMTDNSGNVFITGYAGNASNVATAGAFMSVASGSGRHGFVAKFNGIGIRQWGTFYGDGTSSGTQVTTCKINAAGDVFIGGHTISLINIATPGSYLGTNPAPGSPFSYLAAFTTSGSRIWGTYSWGTEARSCSLGKNGDIFLYGNTASGLNVASPGAHQTTYGGSSYDAFLIKFYMSACPLINGNVVTTNANCSNTSNGSATVTPDAGTSPYTYSWSPAGGTGVVGTNMSAGVYTVFITDSNSCTGSKTFTLNYNFNTPTLTAFSTSSLLCTGQSATLSAFSTPTYTWSTGSNLQNITITPSVTTSYTVSGTQNGCVGSTVFTQSVSTCAGLNEQAKEISFVVFPNPGNGFYTLKCSQSENLIIYNALGQEIERNHFEAGVHTLDLRQRANGLYLLHLSNTSGVQVIRLIKE
jgi:hypothetical protein